MNLSGPGARRCAARLADLIQCTDNYGFKASLEGQTASIFEHCPPCSGSVLGLNNADCKFVGGFWIVAKPTKTFFVSSAVITQGAAQSLHLISPSF